MAKYSFTVCGGTFDLFHKGHELFLKKTLESSEKVLIGITSNIYVNSFKKNFNIEDFEIRKKAVENFLESVGERERAKIVPIDNAFEPYLETSTDYDAISVTPHTLKAAQEINLKRINNNITELEIVLVPFLKAEDEGIISSTRIRNGEINRKGRLYLSPKWQSKNLILPEKMRPELQIPWGEIIGFVPKGLDGTKVITIGDATTQEFNKNNVGQFLSIVDFLIKREKHFSQLSELGFKTNNALKVKNIPGTISFKLFEAVKRAFKSGKEYNIILIDGEDDLAVLPVILVSPIGISIFYGQPNQGLVRIVVNEENKERAYALVETFDMV